MIGVRRDPTGRTKKWEAALAVAGLGRAVLGLYDSREAAAIAHDDAKLSAAAVLRLTAKPAHRQRYNFPDRAAALIASGEIGETHPALIAMAARRSSVMAADLGIPVRETPAAARAAAALESRLAALEARVTALEVAHTHRSS